jgi:hypothetical protein
MHLCSTIEAHRNKMEVLMNQRTIVRLYIIFMDALMHQSEHSHIDMLADKKTLKTDKTISLILCLLFKTLGYVY